MEPTDQDTLERIRELVDEEHRLREALQRHDAEPGEEQQQLRAVEIELDQCWDLLRQRRALRRTGGDPRQASARPADEVEGYLN